MAKNLLSCSPLHLIVTVIVVCICFADAHQSGLQKQSTDDANKGVFVCQSGVEKLLPLIMKQQDQIVEMIKSDRERAKEFQNLILEMIENDRERAKEFQSYVLENFAATYASIKDLNAAIKSLQVTVELLKDEIEILKIRVIPSSDSTAEEPQSNTSFEILLSTGKWVSIGFTAASLICEFGFLDVLPIVSGMKAVICPLVKMSSY